MFLTVDQRKQFAEIMRLVNARDGIELTTATVSFARGKLHCGLTFELYAPMTTKGHQISKFCETNGLVVPEPETPGVAK